MLFGFLRQGAELRGSEILYCTDLRDQETPGDAEMFQAFVAPVDYRCRVIAGELSQLLYCNQIIIGFHQPQKVLDQKPLLFWGEIWGDTSI